MVERLNKDKISEFQYELAIWFYDNKNYALSYMALGEAVITKTAEIKLPEEDITDKDVREEAKRRIDHPYDKHYWHYKEKDTISEIRNNIAHQLLDRKDKVNQDIEKLKFFLDDFKTYFKQVVTIQPFPQQTKVISHETRVPKLKRKRHHVYDK